MPRTSAMTTPHDAGAAGLALEFDGTGSALYVRVSSDAVERTESIGDDVLVDYGEGAAIVGFEIVGLTGARLASVLARLRAEFARRVPALEQLALFGFPDAPATAGA